MGANHLRRPIPAHHSKRQPPGSLQVYAWSLGCPKNRVDTEHLLGSLGLPIETVPSPARARLVFINTCAFIEPAASESIQAILTATSKIKRQKHKPLLAVAGCLPGRYGVAELSREIPEVDLWLDIQNQNDWPRQLLQALRLPIDPQEGRLISSPSQLWLKIAEGCQHNCAFCTIPSIRGKLRSTPAQALLAEAKKAVAGGIRELDLVAQDVTAWGRDLARSDDPKDLPGLLRMLAAIPDLAWIRLFYLYPTSITDELLEVIAEDNPILPYLDIPLQHSETGILKNMGRPFSADPRALLEKIYARLPNAALRATLMVGYPGETEKDFQQLCDFTRQAKFYNLGVFAFMPEEGTRAFGLPGQIEPKIREERKKELMAIQAQISREILAQYVDQKMDVLVDRVCEEIWPGLHAGRVWFQAPEVDGITYISGPGVRPGAMIKAEIADSQTYDLSALV